MSPPPPSPFLETLIRFRLPFFIGTAADMDAARTEILDTLAAYGTRTRAEMLNAAQIIAFGMSTLDTLAEAKTAELSPSMRLRYRGCANGLNRSTLQNEKALDRRLACEPPSESPPEPTNDTPDHQVQATLDQAQAKIDLARNRLATPRPTSSTTLAQAPNLPERNKQLWASAMMDTLQQMGVPAAPTRSG
jgi:hypothetical protein